MLAFFPRKVTADDELSSQTPACVGTFLEFLAEEPSWTAQARCGLPSLSSPLSPRAGQPERTLEQLAAAQGVRGARSLDDLVAFDIWQSDEELAEFLALTYAERDHDR